MESPIKNNVSNTVDVPNDQWDAVCDWVWENQDYIAGVTFLSTYGDMDLPQAPMCKVSTAEEILREYGVGSMFASGRRRGHDRSLRRPVEGLRIGSGPWRAALRLGLRYRRLHPASQRRGRSPCLDREHVRGILAARLQDKVENLAAKRDYRPPYPRSSPHNYYRGDIYKAVNVLKSVNNLHLFEVLKKTYKPVDWRASTSLASSSPMPMSSEQPPALVVPARSSKYSPASL